MNETYIRDLQAHYAGCYPALINLKQAAEIAQSPIGTIHNWSSAGRLDAFKSRRGREVRLHRDAFIEFLTLENDGDVDDDDREDEHGIEADQDSFRGTGRKHRTK
jgi:hypothetical protein